MAGGNLRLVRISFLTLTRIIWELPGRTWKPWFSPLPLKGFFNLKPFLLKSLNKARITFS